MLLLLLVGLTADLGTLYLNFGAHFESHSHGCIVVVVVVVSAAAASVTRQRQRRLG